MQEVIYKLDNETIIKLLGGTAVILVSIIGFFSAIILTRLKQSGQHHYDSKLEDVRGEISKNNSILNSVVQDYFSSSQRILNKKIKAYDALWKRILEIKAGVPVAVKVVHDIVTDDEINSSNGFNHLNSTPTLGPLLRGYNTDADMKPLLDGSNSLILHKPYLSDSSYKLYYTYNALYGRVSYMFITEYKKEKLYNWKRDEHLASILKITVNDKELEYIKSVKIGSMNILVDLLEHKILQDLKNNLNIKNTAEDTIKYLKDIENIVNINK